MGQLVCAEVQADDELELVGTYDVDNINELDETAAAADLVIDFSNPAALSHVIAYASRTGAAVTSGTTGLTEEDLQSLRELGVTNRVVWASNYSLGVAVLRRVVAQAAKALGAWDVEIVETHHNRKVDAPSGTAIMLADAVREARPELHYNLGRSGMAKREPDEIGISAIRMGNIVGTHEVMFGTNTQTITVAHQAHDRALFADGAVAAARFLAGKPAGLYNMDDLLAD